MSHYAKIENNLVASIIVADQEFVDNLEGTWLQTSYNTRGNVHYGQDGQPDNGVALRGNYACIGYTYDEANDVFYKAQPFPSWVLNESTWLWEAPVARPADYLTKLYYWNEATKSWDLSTSLT